MSNEVPRVITGQHIADSPLQAMLVRLENLEHCMRAVLAQKSQHDNDYQRLWESMIAIQKTLGINPQGDCATVCERLERLEALATFQQSNS